MLTQCPNCGAIYRVNASELNAARGFVECGDCADQFNALDRLADEPTFAAATETEAQSTAADAPTFFLLDNTAETTDAPESGSMPLVDQTEVPLDSTDDLSLLKAKAESMSEQQPAAAQHTLPPEDHAILFTEPETDSDIEMTPVVEAPDGEYVDLDFSQPEDDLDLDEVPAILQDEVIAMNRPRAQRLGWLWALISFVLLMALAAQLSWRYRDEIISNVPQTKAAFQLACESLGCALTQPVEENPIQLLSRDVREHPRYENALLVNATILNNAETTAAFPEIQLGLYDQTGTALGIRRFAPRDYLDKSIDIQNGLPAGRSVHVVLELASGDDRAVSFEFAFF